MRKLFKWAVVCALLAAPALGQAQGPSSYPDRPIRLVVAFVAGGATDTLARQISNDLKEALGQTVRQLSTELDELSRRRTEVATLAERLARVEATAREVEARQAGLESRRQQLEELRAGLEAIHTSRASAAGEGG